MPDALEVLVDSLHLSGLLEYFTLLEASGPALPLHFLKLLKSLYALENGVVVGECSAKPSFCHVEHSGSFRMLSDALPTLLLGCHEKNILAAGNNLADQVDCVFQILSGLLEVDDMDTVTGHEDVILHSGVPALLLVAEVYSGFQQILNSRALHCVFPFG